MFIINDENKFVITPLRCIGSNFYQAVVMVCDVPSNLTQRTFPLVEMTKVCAKFHASQTEMFGYCTNIPPPVNAIIPLDKISHKVIDIRIFSSKEVYVTIKLLNTPCGRVLKSLLESDLDLYLHMSATGIIVENGVVKDLELISFHIGT